MNNKFAQYLDYLSLKIKSYTIASASLDKNTPFHPFIFVISIMSK